MRTPYARRGPLPNSYTADKAARRAATIQRVRILLGQGPQSCFDLSAVIGLPSGTLYDYLCQMREAGEVYLMDHVDRRGRETWAMGTEQIEADRVAAEHSSRARIVTARQVGMPRDFLVAALFGPAQGATA